MLSHLKSLLTSKAAQSVACRKEGDAHLTAGRMDEAQDAYARALLLDRESVDARVGLGYVFNERGDFTSAKEMLGEVVTIDPANADAHYMLGTIASQEREFPEAMQHFDRAIECRSDFEFAYRDLFTLLSQRGEAQRARDVIDKAASACPEAAGLHYTRGKVLVEEGNYPDAVDSFRKATSLAPGTAEYHKHLADALKKSGQSGEAVASFQKAVWFDPDFYDGHLALGDELHRQERFGEAVAHYQRALALQPQSALAHVNLGVALQAQGKFDAAIASYRRAAELAPRMTVAHSNLGGLLMSMGEKEAAIECLEKVLEIDPGHNARHVLVSLKGGDSERAPGAYVEKLFDWYAATFDSHLVDGLKYSVPEKLRDLLQPYASNAEKWTVLDLGCGTGLAGVAVAPFARSLVGVDLSAKMLDKARERNLYDRLEQGDLLAMMQSEASSAYDVVIAADVFVYLGKLDELAAEAQRLLHPGGYFAFSVESLDALADGGAPDSRDKDYRLNATSRFAHSAGYLDRLCQQCGFEELGMTGTQSRVNEGKGVQGYLVVWKKSRADRAAAALQPPSGNI